jgi:hypothetical protein
VRYLARRALAQRALARVLPMQFILLDIAATFASLLAFLAVVLWSDVARAL